MEDRQVTKWFVIVIAGIVMLMGAVLLLASAGTLCCIDGG